MSKKPLFYTDASAMGDVLCSTPTIRKISQIYGSKVVVVSKHNYLFKNSPYISKIIPFEDFREEDHSLEYDVHKTFFHLGKKDPLGIEFKHAICDIRQFHAKDLGFMLSSNDLSCDYFPENFTSCMEKIDLPEKYVVIHPSKTWDSRTWPKDQWQKLVDALNEEGIYVVSIGKNSSEFGWKSIQDKPIFDLDIKIGIDLTNRTTLDQLWHIISLSECVVTMDSGVLHLAGTTDSEIIQLGSSINPEFRAPYRKGSQNYKYSYIAGQCTLNCASDLYYSLKEWGEIQSVPLIGSCLENKPTFECNPEWKKVFLKVLEICSSDYNTEEKIKGEKKFPVSDFSIARKKNIFSEEEIKVSYRDGCRVEILGEEKDQRIFEIEFWDQDKNSLVHSSSIRINHWTRTSRRWYTSWKVIVKSFGEIIFEDSLDLENKKVLISSANFALGDSLCWIPYFKEFEKKNRCEVIVQSGFNDLLKKYYPDIKWESLGTYDLDDDFFYASYRVGYGIDQQKHKKGIETLNIAFQRGKDLKSIDIGSVWNPDHQPNHPHLIPLQKIGSDALGLEYREIRPRFILPNSDRPMKEKYICISEFASSEGMKEWKNPIGWQKLVDLLNGEGFKVVSISKEKTNLKGVVKRNGDFSLVDRCYWLQHSEFFIGVSSGLSWLAWACGKKVVTISGATNMWNEFLEDNLRIINLESCHGCWNNPDYTDKLACFHSSFCPADKNFECTRKISPSGVFDKIKKYLIERSVPTEDSVLIKIESKALGDSIGSVCAIEEYRKRSGKKVGVICNFYSNFSSSYPEISFYPHQVKPISSKGFFSVGLEKYREFKSIDYKYDEPLMEGYASQLGIKMDSSSIPRWNFKIGSKPIKEKYFCFSMHSTAQAKHWNFPGGWEGLCRLLADRGYLPVCIDQNSSFGNSENMNPIPSNCIDRTGMKLDDVCNYIHHAEFFVGISSGLSWLSHAVGKHVVMISGLTDPSHEFQNNVTRISNPDVCHGCFNNPSKYPFDKGDWTWCPENKGTDRHFECSKTITPELVLEKIEKYLHGKK